jgi:hypothetical protein
MSLARNCSRSPSPITSGQSTRAAIRSSGRPANTTPIAYAPRSRVIARRTASSGSPVSFRASSITWGITSVSVPEQNRWAPKAARSSAWFSMMPLWTTPTAPSQEKCGCAFADVTPPWVAQRVWPRPAQPGMPVPFRTRSRSPTRPAVLTHSSRWSVAVTTPAES